MMANGCLHYEGLHSMEVGCSCGPQSGETPCQYGSWGVLLGVVAAGDACHPIHRRLGRPLDVLCCSRQAVRHWHPLDEGEDLARAVPKESEDGHQDDAAVGWAVAVADDDTLNPGKIHRCGILEDHPQKEAHDEDDDLEDNSRLRTKTTKVGRGDAGAAAGTVQSQGHPYVDRRDPRQETRHYFSRDIRGVACFPCAPNPTCYVPVPSRAPFSRGGVSCCYWCCCLCCLCQREDRSSSGSDVR